MSDQNTAADPVVPLEDALAPYDEATKRRRIARLGTTPVGRRALLAALNDAVLEHEDAWAAVVRGDEGEPGRRLCRAQLLLVDAYEAAGRLYRAESPTRAAMVNAGSYLLFAAAGSPHYQQVRVELAAAGTAVSA